jgi:oxygen-independent coproporphyrinogen-3 oxidase
MHHPLISHHNAEPDVSAVVDQVLAVYVHLPFCEYRCSYCDFATYADQDHQMTPYVDAVIAELALRVLPGERRGASTIFFGGGTPSRLPVSDLNRILEALKRSFVLSPNAEITLEANPGTLDLAHMRDLRAAGVSRLSVGVQSLNNDILLRLNRIHDAEQAILTLRRAKEAGFDSVSADLIFGLPGQDRDDWERTLHGVLAAGPDHVSVYGLIVEPGTLLRRQVLSGRVRLPSDDDAADMYERTRELLGASGYVQYEVSNWARPGHQCRHNLIYWEHEPYLGVGLSAHSYVDGERFGNVRGLQGYLNRVARQKLPTATHERIDTERARADAAMLGLRLIGGIHVNSFDSRFGGSFLDDHSQAIERLSSMGLLEVDQGYVRLSSRGYLLANQVWQEFI